MFIGYLPKTIHQSLSTNFPFSTTNPTKLRPNLVRLFIRVHIDGDDWAEDFLAHNFVSRI